MLIRLLNRFLNRLGEILFGPQPDLLAEFTAKFPGECPICSYHRYGIMNSYLDPDEPVPEHDCIAQ